MFQKDQLIVYGKAGVCRVQEIGHPRGVRNIDGDRLYYTLVPLFQAGIIYAPVDTPVFMRPALTRDEAEELIRRIPAIREDEYCNSDQRLLASHYNDCLDTAHRCEDLVQLVKTVYQRSSRSRLNRKNPRQVDLVYLKRAEELLHGEFAAALSIPPQEVAAYITRRLQEEGEAVGASQKTG